MQTKNYLNKEYTMSYLKKNHWMGLSILSISNFININIFAAEPQQQIQELPPTENATLGVYGGQMAVVACDDLVIFGVPGADCLGPFDPACAPGGGGANSNNNVGKVCIYRRTNYSWNLETILYAFDKNSPSTIVATPGEELGRSLTFDGEWLAVGAQIGHDVECAGSVGSVYLYKYDSILHTWTPHTKITNPDADPLNPLKGKSDRFGRKITNKNGILIIGAFGDDPSADPSPWQNPCASGVSGNTDLPGTVYSYLFDINTNTWQFHQKLNAPAGTNNQNCWFGSDVSIDGNWLAVAAFRDNQAGFWGGAVYMYQWDNQTSLWVFHSKLMNTPPPQNPSFPYTYFGTSIALKGDTLVVGSPFHGPLINNPVAGGNPRAAGRVYIYQYSGTTWSPSTTLLPSVDEWGIEFGCSVSIDIISSIRRVAIGAHQTNVFGSVNAGKARVFESINGGTWTPIAELQEKTPVTGNFLGERASISGDIVALTSRNNAGAFGLETGSIPIFWIGPLPPTPSPIVYDSVTSPNVGSLISANLPSMRNPPWILQLSGGAPVANNNYVLMIADRAIPMIDIPISTFTSYPNVGSVVFDIFNVAAMVKGQFDPSGAATEFINIPLVPQLIGLEFELQWMSGTSPIDIKMSNGLRMTVGP